MNPHEEVPILADGKTTVFGGYGNVLFFQESDTCLIYLHTSYTYVLSNFFVLLKLMNLFCFAALLTCNKAKPQGFLQCV